jgi:hypothetical protein
LPRTWSAAARSPSSAAARPHGVPTLSPSEAITDENGDADFTGSIIDKAGGYKLLAFTQPSADADGAAGFLPDSVTSANRFLWTPN